MSIIQKNLNKLGLIFAAITIGLGSVSCELFDPPPSSTDVEDVLGDLTDGARVAHAGGDAAASVEFVSSDERIIRFDNYQGENNNLSGEVTYLTTVTIADHYYELIGIVEYTGGKVRNIEFQNTGWGYADDNTRYGGIIIVNDYYEFDAETYERVM